MSEAVQTLPAGFVPVMASYGDETQTTDVTTSLLSKVRGTSVDVVADKSLIPALSFSDSVNLTPEEQEEIKAQATAECGGRPNDNKCMETLVDRYTQAKLQEKAALQTQAGAVKGDRLTVIATNPNGQQRTFYVPKGTRLLGGDAASDYLAKKAAGEQVASFWETIQPTVYNVIWMGLLAFLYVFSILTTWRNLTERGYGVGRYVGTGLAIAIPYSGFLIQLGLFAAVWYARAIGEGLEKTAPAPAPALQLPELGKLPDLGKLPKIGKLPSLPKIGKLPDLSALSSFIK